MSDDAYLFIPPNLDHPAAGKTVAVPMADFKANIKEWQALGIRPATGQELAPVQEQFKRQTAAESPGTAAAVGGLRGATFGLSDVAFRALGDEESGADLERLRQENPKLSMASEIAGGIATGGGLAKLGTKAVSSAVPSALARQAVTGAGVGGLASGGMELSRQARQEKDYSLPDVLSEAGKGALIGGALPVAGAGLKTATRAGMRGLRRVGPYAEKSAEYLNDLPVETTLAADMLGAGGLVTGAKIFAGRALKFRDYIRSAIRQKSPDVAEDTIEEATDVILDRLRQSSKQGFSTATDVADDILASRAGPFHPSAAAKMARATSQRSTGQMSQLVSKTQAARKAEADSIAEEIKRLLGQ